MSVTNCGQPAFPNGQNKPENQGMSYYDWLMGMVLQGMLASGDYTNTPTDVTVGVAESYVDETVTRLGL